MALLALNITNGSFYVKFIQNERYTRISLKIAQYFLSERCEGGLKVQPRGGKQSVLNSLLSAT